jgi:hypothetical protein
MEALIDWWSQHELRVLFHGRKGSSDEFLQNDYKGESKGKVLPITGHKDLEGE